MTPQHPAVPPHYQALPRLLLAVALMATALVYWVGLRGPFLLDDAVNLGILQRWLERAADFNEVAFNTTASPFGRPLAMASFAVSAWLGGYTPFAFKLGNLITHVACGLVVYGLSRRLALCDPRMQPIASWIGLFVAAAWLLHPLQASTVLYAVQRMAQLAALSMLSALWLYVVARSRLQRGPSRAAAAGLLIGVPALAVAGFLSKENALLVPVLCLVLELGCFPRPPLTPKPVVVFFALVLALPAAVGVTLFAIEPDYVLGGYTMRDFTLVDRLLTQPRVLCDYLWSIVVPNPMGMGVYTDDFVASKGLLSPPTTLIALLVLALITWLAIRWRREVPALFIGWGLFLAGHAMEAGVLPLELYFEHRNYLPIVGILYALAGLAATALRLPQSRSSQIARAVPIATLTVLALLAFGTHVRARVWGDEALLVEAAVAAHPGSMRAQLAVVDAAVRLGNPLRAERALATMTRSDKNRTRAQGYLNRVNLRCALAHSADPDDLQAAVRNAPVRMTKDEAETFALLMSNTRQPCNGISDSALATAAAAFADAASTQRDSFGPKAELRHTSAQLHARGGDWQRALPQARLAWQPGMPAAASVILVNAQLATGDLQGAEETYRQAAARARAGNASDAAGLRWLRKRIDRARTQTADDAAKAP